MVIHVNDLAGHHDFTLNLEAFPEQILTAGPLAWLPSPFLYGWQATEEENIQPTSDYSPPCTVHSYKNP